MSPMPAIEPTSPVASRGIMTVFALGAPAMFCGHKRTHQARNQKEQAEPLYFPPLLTRFGYQAALRSESANKTEPVSDRWWG